MVAPGRPVVAFVLPHLRVGGIEALVRSWVNGLDRARWQPVLILNRAEGAFLDGIAGDVPVRSLGGRRMVGRAVRLAPAFRRDRVGVVYSGTNAMNLSAALALSMMPRGRRPRLILSEHTTARDYLAQARRPRLRRALLRRLYPLADRLASPLPGLADGWLRELGLTRPAPLVLPNPVFEAEELVALQADPPRRHPHRIVAAGRLEKVKGHDDLIRAAARVCTEFPEMRLDIFGDGPERSRLQALIDALGLSGAVILRGHTDRLLHEIAGAAVLALASHREGFGNVVAEAMAVRTPVVATDCAGPRALLEGGRLGTLVPAGEPEALAAALAGHLRTPPDPAILDRAARAVEPYETGAALAAFEVALEELAAPASGFR